MAWGSKVPSRVAQSAGPGWGRQILTGSGAPADALGNLSDRYYDTVAQRYYIKRYVGNFNNDNVLINTPFIGGDTDWRLSFLLAAPLGTGNQRFVGQSMGSYVANEITVDQFTTNPQIRFGQTSGASVIAAGGVDGLWHRVDVSRAGTTHAMSVDGVFIGTMTIGTGILVVPTQFVVGNGTGGTYAVCKIANLTATRGANRINLPFDDGTGTAVRDISGNGNTGTLTDGTPATFWLQTWVPEDLL